jgi:gas vesicle structural protein
MEERDIPLQAPRDDGTLIDVLDRVLDKGIVIDAWARMSVVGIDLMTVQMKVVVASIDTYLLYSDRLDLRYLAYRK